MKRTLSFFIMCLGCMLIMCAFAPSEALAHPEDNISNISNIYDKKISTYWKFRNGDSFETEIPQGKRYMLLRFRLSGFSARVTTFDSNGEKLTERNHSGDKPAYCLTMPERAKKVHIEFLCQNALCRADFYAEPTHEWKDAPQSTDILLISTHQDDEEIFMGGLMPLFIDSGKTVTVAYTAGKNRVRMDEALEGLWRVGVRHYPDFLGFRDLYEKPSVLEQKWGGKEYILGRFVELIRRRRPQIVVTHDFNGEYGHGAHRFTASLVDEAVLAAADPSRYPESAEQYGAWSVKKLYIHLYGKNQIRLNYAKPLAAFENKNAAEVAMHGYLAHVSQRKNQDKRFRLAISGEKWDNSLFGLRYSTVGYNNKGFFSGIDENYDSSLTAESITWSVELPPRPGRDKPGTSETPTVTPAATPTVTPAATPAVTPIATPTATITATPTATPTAALSAAAPTETAEEAPSPTPEVSGTAKQDDGGTESDGRVVLYAVAAMLLAAAGAIALLVRKPHKKSKKKSRKK